MEGSRKLEQACDWAVLIGSITLVMILIVVAFGFFGRTESTPVAPAPSAPIAPVVNVDNIDDHPFVSAGIHSWVQWEKEATPEMREALLEVADVTSQQTQQWAAEEQAFGREFLAELPVGLPIVNTGISRAGNWYRVNGYLVRTGDTTFLVTDKGIPAVKISCGNPVALKPPTVAELPREEPTPPKGGNPYPNFVREHQEAVPLPPRTPGYTPGNADRVREEQGRQPIGGTDPTPPGTPGVGSGGVTPPGQGRNPDGSLIVAQPPTILPPYQPPPLSEVGTGVPLPPKPN